MIVRAISHEVKVEKHKISFGPEEAMKAPNMVQEKVAKKELKKELKKDEDTGNDVKRKTLILGRLREQSAIAKSELEVAINGGESRKRAISRLNLKIDAFPLILCGIPNIISSKTYFLLLFLQIFFTPLTIYSRCSASLQYGIFTPSKSEFPLVSSTQIFREEYWLLHLLLYPQNPATMNNWLRLLTNMIMFSSFPYFAPT